MGDQDPSKLSLDVYDTNEGLWNPEADSLDQPEGWEFLPGGDAFVTRRVKAAGTHWKLWRPRGRNHPRRRLLDLLAPKAAIEAALAEAASSEAARSGRRAQGAVYRARKEDIYRQELTEAVLAYLGFAPEHAELAQSIATQAAQRTSEVGSGRVGRNTDDRDRPTGRPGRPGAHPAPLHRLRGPPCPRSLGRRVPLPGGQG